MKRTTMSKCVLSAAALLAATAASSEAAIVWEGEFNQFNFSVMENGGSFVQRMSQAAPYNLSPDEYPVVANAQDTRSASSYGATVSSSPSTSPLAANLSMQAGAWGTGTSVSPADGLAVHAFAEMGFAGFDPAWQGVTLGQEVLSMATRNFSVDAAGSYDFSASLAGPVHFEDAAAWYPDPWGIGFPPGCSLAEHDLTLAASLTGYTIDAGMSRAMAGGSTNLALSLANPGDSVSLQLRPQTDMGENIYYKMAISILLNTDLNNNDNYFSFTMPIEALDGNGNGHLYLGTAQEPLSLNAAITPSAPLSTPLPASGLLLLSGMGGLAFLRRRLHF